MKWTPRPEAREGDLRRRTAFLWLPMTISKLTKWWEVACWIELRQRAAYDKLEWQPISWRTPLPSDLPAGKGFLRNLYQRFFKQQTNKITL